MTPIKPSTRLLRIVRKMERFQVCSNGNLDPSYQELLRDEKIIGVYRGDLRNEDIAFSEEAFFFTEFTQHAVVRISYDRLQFVDYPRPASGSVDLNIQLTDLSVICVRVVGIVGRFRDVFEMGRFFMRVAEDAGKGVRLVRDNH